MGYEVKIIIGCLGTSGKKAAREEAPVIDCDTLYYPYLRGEDGGVVYTNTIETYFMSYAEIDLCKIGDAEIGKVLTVNKGDSEIYWYGADGNTRIHSDCYDDKPNVASVADCIKALEVDVKNDDYRQFKWALALLKSMKGENDVCVIWCGH